jgi:hypothetical protein
MAGGLCKGLPPKSAVKGTYVPCPMQGELNRNRQWVPGGLTIGSSLTPLVSYDAFQSVHVLMSGDTSPLTKNSTSVKPLVNNEGCQGSHLQYHVSGRMHVIMEDGSEEEFIAGDMSLIPPGHDAWVVGEEPVVVIELSGMVHYH